MTEQQAIRVVIDELNRARQKHPQWPPDKIYAAAIVAEEAGELVQASLDYVYKPQYQHGHMEEEAIQTAAMAIRFLIGE